MSVNLTVLDTKLRNPPRMTYQQCVKWILDLKGELVQLRSGVKSQERTLTALQNILEKKPGGEQVALSLLRECGRVPLEAVPEPPLDQKRKEFMVAWRKSPPDQKARLEEAAQAGGDKVLLAAIEKEKA